jgi:hypothetical protein
MKTGKLNKEDFRIDERASCFSELEYSSMTYPEPKETTYSRKLRQKSNDYQLFSEDNYED